MHPVRFRRAVLSALLTCLLAGSASADEFEFFNGPANWLGETVTPLIPDQQSQNTEARVGAIIFDRSTQDDGLNGLDLDLGVSGGAWVDLFQPAGDGKVYTFSYMGLYDQSETFSPAIVPGFVTDTFLAEYESQFHSFELSAGEEVSDWLTVFLGFRYFYLDEELYLAGTLIGPQNYGATASTHNNLFGLQLRGDLVLWENESCSINSRSFAGLYANYAIASAGGQIGGVPGAAKDRTTRLAFLGGTNLSARYDFNSCISLEGGYQLMWLEGIALAPDQSDNLDITTGAAGVDTHGQALYHGAFINLIVVW